MRIRNRLLVMTWILCFIVSSALADPFALALGDSGYVLSIPGTWSTVTPDSGYAAAVKSPGGEKLNVKTTSKTLEEIWNAAESPEDGTFGGVYWIIYQDGKRYVACTQLTDSCTAIVSFSRSNPLNSADNSAILSSLSKALE